jgi:hypothetical protein
MEPESSLSYFQELATGPYLEPYEPSPLSSKRITNSEMLWKTVLKMDINLDEWNLKFLLDCGGCLRYDVV